MVKHNKTGRKLANKGGSFLKASTKKLNKLVKRGKLKKSVGKKTLVKVLKERVSGKRNEPEIKTVVEENDIPLHEADYDYFSKPGRNYDFLTNLPDVDEDKKTSRRKRKKVDDEGLEMSYEKKLKSNPDHDVDVLPIKIKNKSVYLPKEKTTNDEEIEDDEQGSEQVEENEEEEDVPYIEKYLKREIQIRDAKNSISQLSAAVIQHGSENVEKLSKIVGYLRNAHPFAIQRCAMVNLFGVFNDIIPDYKIRPLTDAERQQKMKKDTKELNTYEECLLTQYEKYLNILISYSQGNVKLEKDEHLSEGKEMKQKRILKRKSIEYLGQLLASHPHFNFRTMIIGAIVKAMFNHDKRTSNLACEAVKVIFTRDKSYEVILEIVRLIGRAVKAKPRKVKPKVLDIFLSLKIKQIQQEEESQLTAAEMRKRNSALSKTERKRKKQMKYLEKELEQAAALDNSKQKNKLRTEVISVVFLIYFRILKMSEISNLLMSVLEGLAKFAHLINVTYFSDLFAVLTKLVESGDLSNRESLLCIQTSLTLLIDQGSSFNIDPSKFYVHLYKTLDNINLTNFESDLPVALKCLDLMINKRKKHVSDQRCMAFIKRISMCVLKLPPSGAIPLLSMIKSTIQNHPKCDLLLDTDGIGSGSFMPHVDNPDHCNAQSSSLYELHLLRSSCDPNVALYAEHILHGLPREGSHKLPLSLSKISPTELFINEADQYLKHVAPSADKSTVNKFSKKTNSKRE